MMVNRGMVADDGTSKGVVTADEGAYGEINQSNGNLH